MTADSSQYPVIDTPQLSHKWQVHDSWVRNHCRRDYTDDPIPHVKLGRYVRFEWGSPALNAWWARRRSGK